MSKVRWVPMESNPDVWNKLLKEMGVSGGWQFTDVWGLDPELLMMVPQPVAAVVLLYPISGNTENWATEKVKGTTLVSDKVFFMRQTVGNACGTVGILHSILNNSDTVPYGETLVSFKAECAGVDPMDRAKKLEQSQNIAEMHATAASSGQTAAPSPEEKVNLHFVAFVCVDGHMYELDGRKEKPMNWGPCQSDELLGNAAIACEQYMSCDPDEVRFTVVALSKME